MKLIGKLVRVADIEVRQRDEMFALMDRYYTGMERNVFEADLSQKQWVIQIVDTEANAIRGFSTQMLLNLEIAGRPLRALFSGDTIVDHKSWAQNTLPQTWGRFALSLIDEDPSIETYWFLISKGYKTYRFLPLFFREFYPRFNVPTPDWAAEVIHALGRYKYPVEYDSDAGIIRANCSAYSLRSGVADITLERLRDPHIRFFTERNPGHARGDELCCIAPLTKDNFTFAAYRAIGPTLVESAAKR